MGVAAGFACTDTPPEDDVCPVCFCEFVLPCRTNCGHWFCGSCILEVWNFSSAFQACKCPMCSSHIKNLKPAGSFPQLQDCQDAEEAKKVLKSINRYNRLFVGGASGLFLILLGFLYMISPLDFIPKGVNVMAVCNLAAPLIVYVIKIIGLLQRRRSAARVRRLAAVEENPEAPWTLTEAVATTTSGATTSTTRSAMKPAPIFWSSIFASSLARAPLPPSTIPLAALLEGDPIFTLHFLLKKLAHDINYFVDAGFLDAIQDDPKPLGEREDPSPNKERTTFFGLPLLSPTSHLSTGADGGVNEETGEAGNRKGVVGEPDVLPFFSWKYCDLESESACSKRLIPAAPLRRSTFSLSNF
ncbi:hypothetical protein V2J09_021622 [Rumex salicifolius]